MKDTLSQDEFEIVIEEMAERVKDIVFANAEKRIREIIEIYADEALNASPNTAYVITYKIHFTAGDIQQIVSRLRRYPNR